MPLTHDLIAEIEIEASNTEKMLVKVPANKFDWRPHEKSMTLKALASHIANLSRMVGVITTTEYLDFAEEKAKHPTISTTEDLLKAFQEGTKQSIEALQSVQDEDLKENWILRRGEYIIMDMPKAAAIRRMGMNHVYHHRAQLGVYLRLLNVSIPGMYGPSADSPA